MRKCNPSASCTREVILYDLPYNRTNYVNVLLLYARLWPTQ